VWNTDKHFHANIFTHLHTSTHTKHEIAEAIPAPGCFRLVWSNLSRRGHVGAVQCRPVASLGGANASPLWSKGLSSGSEPVLWICDTQQHANAACRSYTRRCSRAEGIIRCNLREADERAPPISALNLPPYIYIDIYINIYIYKYIYIHIYIYVHI